MSGAQNKDKKDKKNKEEKRSSQQTKKPANQTTKRTPLQYKARNSTENTVPLIRARKEKKRDV